MQLSDFKIRKFHPRDKNNLTKLFIEMRSNPFYWQNETQCKFKDFINQTLGESIFIAEDKDGHLAGFISVMAEENPPFIHHLFVRPDYQRIGIGQLLIHSLFSWLKLPYQLKCLAKNEIALEFYKKNGWIEIEHGLCEEGEEYVLLELHEKI